jgi:heme-degrading monooxygenase HmoA
MIVSIVTRKTSITDRAQWQSRLDTAMLVIAEVLKAEPGFVSMQYLWGAEGDGQMAQITRWKTLDDCHRYVRGGAAATVAMHEDRALPTAPHPDGAWVRRTFEVAAEG